MKRNLTLIGVMGATILLAGLSVVTALKMRQLGTQPVAPSAPKSKPEATGPTATPAIPEITPAAAACRSVLVVGPTATPTPGPSVTPAATGTPGPSPTPGPSATPTPRPVATNTPVPPTSTPVPGESYCDYLTADVSSGNAPLTVRFRGKGVDSIKVKGFRFTFGDGEKQEVLGSFTSSFIQEVSHAYARVGAYTAILEILDNGDHWRTRDECRLIVTVGAGQALLTSTPGPSATPGPATAVAEPVPTEVQLPSAGLKIPTLTGIIMGFLLISLGAALIF